MAMRKICPNCGKINLDDSYECENCETDIEYERKISVPKDKLGFEYFNKFSSEYSNESPFQPIKKNEEVLEINEQEIEETKTPSKMVKLCPECDEENDENAVECKECGKTLIRVTPTQKGEKNPSVAPSNEIDMDLSLDFSNQKSEYFIVIGKNGENRIDIDFVNDAFIIGRNYQECLKASRNVSRTHCFLKKGPDGNIYLGESTSAPSTFGTYLRIVDDRKQRVVPGKGYPLKSGDVFYLDDVPVGFFKEL